MHVVVIPGGFPNEQNIYEGIFYRQMAMGIAEYGIKTGVIAPDLRPFNAVYSIKSWKQFGKKYSYFLNDNIPVLRKTAINLMPKMHYFNQWKFAQYSLELLDDYIEKYGKPDLIHAHTALWAGWAAFKIKQKYNIPYVITEHSSAFLKQTLSQTALKINEKVYKNASKIMAVSEALKKAMLIHHDYEMEVIPNFIDVTSYELRDHQKNKHQLLTVGSLIQPKGLHILLCAFAKSVQQAPQLRLKIIGDGIERVPLMNLVKQFEISQYVEFTGTLTTEEIAKEYARGGIYVSASFFETFGVTLIEALASGLPVVATRSGGPDDIIHQNNGVLIEKGNVNMLSDAMLYVYRNYNLFDAETIKKDTFSRFDKTKVVEKIIKAYDDLDLLKNNKH